uniref:Cation-transporting ATPase n=1 Tax=Anolis carolinensis TaxID=28377 RepID=H9GB69_ANOCA
MGGKLSLDGHHALLGKGTEDEMEIFGYRTQFFRKALCIAGYLFSCGALLLVFYWKPEWDVWANCVPCNLEEADTVLLRATDEFQRYKRKKVISLSLQHLLDSEKPDLLFSEDRDSVIYRAITRPGLKVRFIQVQKIRYAWDVPGKAFVRVGSLEDSNTCYEIHRKFGDGLTKRQRDLRKLVCGPNAIEIEIRPIWKLLFKEILNPFYVFQAFTLTLWLSQGYYEFATALIILSIISIGLTVYDLRQQSVKLHNLVEEHNKVRVTAWTKHEGGHQSESCHLVPGDVLLLEGQKLSLPCDAILLDGSCVVNEGMLTGESVPVTKTPLPQADNVQPWKKHSLEDHRRHVLFCGTEVIQTRPSGKGPARAVVLQTGFNTAKGDLVRSILYPKPLNFRIYKEAFLFIVGLIFVAIVGLIYGACVYAENKRPVRETAVMALLLLSAVVTPALPAALTTGIVYAQKRLKKRKIFCISPQRINICGQINLVCFDKTGTLTEDGLNLFGVVPCQDASFLPLHSFSSGPLPWGPLCQAMATCHSLLFLEGRIQGDPMDLKMFEGTGWEMEESGSGDPESGVPKTCSVVKPGPKASKAPSEGMSILHQFPFSSSLLRMSVVTKELGKDNHGLYMKGAPETVASFCLPKTVPPSFQAELKSFTAQGFRVIALAHKELSLDAGHSLRDLDRDEVESGLTFLGLLVMENRLKGETRPVLEELREARIRTVMVTGDNLETAITVGRNSGMIPSGDRVILVEASDPEDPHPASVTWQTVEDTQPCKEKNQDPCITIYDKSSSSFHFAMNGKTFQALQKSFSSLLPKILVNGTVFARMSPGQKSSLVEEFQKLDYYVGMCGDGANDCGALKMAHAGISLSEQEASVASPFTSQTPNIQCVPELIREGRAALISSFAVFKYLVLYGMVLFIGCALLYWQMQIFGNYQFLLQDGVAMVACLTMSLTHAHPRLAPFRPSGRLISPPLLLSVVFSILSNLAIQTCGFVFVRRQAWYAQVRSYSPCSPGNQSSFPFGVNGDPNGTSAIRNMVVSYENTTLYHLATLDCCVLAFVFCKGRPFRKPIYSNYIFTCLMSIWLGLCVFILFADIEVIYKGLQLLCTPNLWRGYILIMIVVRFAVSVFVEDALLENRRLWLWIKALLGIRSSSKYRKLQRQVEGEASWPPTNHRDFAEDAKRNRKSKTYVNPAYENSKDV